MRWQAIAKKIAFFLVRAFVAYVALILLWIDLTLFEVALPHYIFERQPFVQAALLVIAISGAISAAIKSRTPVVFTALCVGYSGFVFMYVPLVAWFIALFGLIAAINFLFRNRITEPLLAILPVIIGAWAFLSSAYAPYFVGWAYYVTGNKDLLGSIVEALHSARDQMLPTVAMLPVLVMYFLGKRHYEKLMPIFLRVLPGKNRSVQ